ncbi:MAG: HflX-like GTP-binding protein, partial [Acidithiobacillus sp.]
MLVHVVLHGEADPDGGAEFFHLATDSGAYVLELLSVQRDRPDPATFLGRGKVAELAEQVSDLSVDLVLFDRVLSPVQERNLERALQCPGSSTGWVLSLISSRD